MSRRLLGRRFLTVMTLASSAAGLLAVMPLPSGSASAASGPAFVQVATAHRGGVSSLAVTPAGNLGTGDRLVVEVGVWSSGNVTTSSVSDSAGDPFTELVHFTAGDGAELSVWTAPVTVGAGTRPTVTARTTSAADIGLAALEYSGLSTAGGTAVMDTQAHASGLTGASAATVASGATPATSGPNEVALGFYADSGFGNTLGTGAGFSARANVSPASDMEFLVEDQAVTTGATPNAVVTTGRSTYWLMATVVLKPVPGAATAPSTPAAPSATAGNGSATVSWTAPSDGGGAITSYTVTPSVGAAAQTPVTLTGSPPATTTTIGGLSNGTAYTFTVVATNAVGSSQASPASPAVTPSASGSGQWGALQNWPVVAVHLVALKNGKYLLWDGWQQPQPTELWDPATNTFSTINAPDSIFCAGNVHLPDGRVLVVGGYGQLSTGQLGIKDTTIFDPSTSTWSRATDMNSPRWYPSLLHLPDGRYVAISGNSTDPNTWADTPEVYNPSTNTWTLLSKVSTPQIHEEEYPFSFMPPSGKPFVIGPAEDVSYTLDVANQTWTSVGSSGLRNGSAVMYRPGKILYSGGAPSVTTTTTSAASAAVIDLTAATPSWTPVSPMAYPRVYHTLTMLADGKVLAVGGETSSDQTNATVGQLATEIWDPATQTWTTGASMAVARNYHSSATLMSDGRVLVAGGGHEDSLGGQAQYNAQIYSPPYLSAGPRPTIASAPSSATYGSSMTVATPDAANISAVNLVSLGADTHQSDMDQHFVPLSFTAGSGSLAVQAPAGEALAPPGDYMMFIVNSTGVPSVAAPVHIDAAAAVPGAPTGVTAIAGNGSATVSWTAPAVGGSPVTSYTVTPYLGTTAQPPVTVTGNPPAISTTVTGLTNGSAYTFTAAATNAVGTGPTSAPSGAVTPGAVGPIGVDKTVFTDGTGTMASPAITTSGPGELLVALVSLDGPAAAAGQAATVTGAGLTWTLARRANTRYGDAEIWYARATGTLTNQTVTATPAASGFHGSMTVLALQKAAGIGTGAAASAATGAPDLPIAGTGIGSWVYAVGNDWDGATTRTPSTGQVLVHQRVDTPVGDTFWVQTTTSANTAAGTVDIHDTAPTNHQWNVSAVEVLPGT